MKLFQVLSVNPRIYLLISIFYIFAEQLKSITINDKSYEIEMHLGGDLVDKEATGNA